MRTPLRLRKWLARQLMPELDKLRTDAERQANIALMSRMKQCGEGCGLWGAVHITGVEEMSLGRNVHIGGGAFIRAEGGYPSATIRTSAGTLCCTPSTIGAMDCEFPTMRPMKNGALSSIQTYGSA